MLFVPARIKPVKKGGVLFELVQIPMGVGGASLARPSGTVLYGTKQKGVCWINRKFPVGGPCI